MAYTLNSRLIERNTHPYQSAMISLHSRTDFFDTATTGSGALMSLQRESEIADSKRHLETAREYKSLVYLYACTQVLWL